MTDYENDCPHLFQYVSTFGWEDATALCDRLVNGIESASAECLRHDDGDHSGGAAEDDESSHDDYDDDEDDDDYYCDHYYDCGGGGGRSRRRRRRRRNGASLLRRMLRLAREQLYYRDQWGNTPLHAALYVKPPIDVVSGLFRVGRALFTHRGGGLRRGVRRGGVIGSTEEECGDCDHGHHTPIWATTSGDGSTPFLGERKQKDSIVIIISFHITFGVLFFCVCVCPKQLAKADYNHHPRTPSLPRHTGNFDPKSRAPRVPPRPSFTRISTRSSITSK